MYMFTVFHQGDLHFGKLRFKNVVERTTTLHNILVGAV